MHLIAHCLIDHRLIGRQHRYRRGRCLHTFHFAIGDTCHTQGIGTVEDFGLAGQPCQQDSKRLRIGFHTPGVGKSALRFVEAPTDTPLNHFLVAHVGKYTCHRGFRTAHLCCLTGRDNRRCSLGKSGYDNIIYIGIARTLVHQFQAVDFPVVDFQRILTFCLDHTQRRPCRTAIFGGIHRDLSPPGGPPKLSDATPCSRTGVVT